MGEWINRYKEFEKKVGGGFYSMRTQFAKSGKVYGKLVKADRSPVLQHRGELTPNIGKRTDKPAKRRARRNNV